MNSDGSDVPPQRRNVYYRIRAIFPLMNVTKIKDLILYPETYGISHNIVDDHFISNLSEYLLQNSENFMDLNLFHDPNDWQYKVAENYEMQAERLIGIFPDADPEFLTYFAMHNYTNPKSINTFIEENLFKKNYPTYDEYLERQRIDEAFIKYFVNFNLEDFLKEFPNPIEHFENELRICEENEDTKSLLPLCFSNLENSVVLEQYYNSKFNATIAAKNLEKNYGGILQNFSIESSTLLKDQMQEFAFIFHRKMIEDKLEEISRETKIPCEICLNDFVKSKCSTCNIGHIICNACISEGIDVRMADAVYNTKCFAICESSISNETLEKVLTSKVYSILIRKIEENALVESGRNVHHCPFCSYLFEFDENSNIFTCLNEDCKKQSCRLCNKLNHLPYACEDVVESIELNIRLYFEEKLSQAVMRRCLTCNKKFMKSDGCNRMICSCGTVQCYLCNTMVDGNSYKHFNGQGSERQDLCPLYSDDKRLEARSIIEIANALKRKYRNNPNFNEEAINRLIPTLPPRSEGPHDQIPNANQLPAHTIQVARGIIP